jgi:hypothetical protein
VFNIAFNYATAHHLAMNLRASSQGISAGGSWIEQSKSVGPVSQSFAIPQYILDHPVLSMLARTAYGQRYLQMVISETVGVVFIAQGDTLP